MSDVRFPELRFYTLAGAPGTNRTLLNEVRRGDELGLGTAFVSERYKVEEAAALSGAAGAISENLRNATGVTNHNTRHPMVTASFATTMYELTDGRFVLGLGCGIAMLQDLYGISRISPVRTNDWDPAALDAFRADAVVGSFAGGIDEKAATDQLEHIAGLLADEWLAPAATGSAAQCVDAIERQFALGWDAVTLHRASPDEREPAMAAYAHRHPA